MNCSLLRAAFGVCAAVALATCQNAAHNRAPAAQATRTHVAGALVAGTPSAAQRQLYAVLS